MARGEWGWDAVIGVAMRLLGAVCIAPLRLLKLLSLLQRGPDWAGKKLASRT